MAKKGSTQSMIKQDRKKMTFSIMGMGREVSTALPHERLIKGGEIISWGTGNVFPYYLIDHITDCPTLNTIIGGCTDYIMGNGIEFLNMPPGFDYEKVNQHGDNFQNIIKKVVCDLVSFGGFAIQIIYDKLGAVSELYYQDIANCRLSPNHDSVYFINRRWSSYTDLTTEIKYPAFGQADSSKKISEFYFYKGNNPRTNYPVPKYYSAMTAIKTEIEIQKFHYNSILNNFASNVMVNINNGIPSDDEKEEFEKGFTDKYTGSENSGKVLFVFNDNKEQAATIERITDDNFDKKYEALAKTTRQNIYASFRAVPALFGIMTETTGFSEQEFEEAFKLFNRTVIQPWQQEIERVFSDILCSKNPFKFKPFTVFEEVEKSKENKENEVIEDIPEQVLSDLTTNERRELIGYPALDDGQADEQLLAERLGVGGTDAFISVIGNEILTPEQKRETLKLLFGLSDEQVIKLV